MTCKFGQKTLNLGGMIEEFGFLKVNIFKFGRMWI